MNLREFDYELPNELIAKRPAERRDEARLMVLNRETGSIEHRRFFDIIEYLHEGDCLVLNDSKVIPARLFGTKEGTGAKVEFLLSRRIEGNRWETLVRPGRRLKVGDRVDFSESGVKLHAEIAEYGDGGTRIVDFECEGNLMETIAQIGKMPLPPYINRESDDKDREDYQTVYCNESGSVASPTAGLHFTEELLKKVEEKGVEIIKVTLHVGIGTFRPVKTDIVEEHHMHFEEYEISEKAAEAINRAIDENRRIISVGTTSVRTLESAKTKCAGGGYHVKKGSNSTDIFIYPGYEFKIVDSLITNFHLPKSTLIMLVSALYNREKILEAYKEAVEQKYRFFSYGDAMFIE